MLEDAGCRAVTIPQIGWRVSNLDQSVAAAELARVTTTHLRRRSRLSDLCFVSRHADYLHLLKDELDALLRIEQAGSSGATP